MRAKEARSRLTPAEIARYSASIERRLIEVLDGFTTVMVYVSKPPEVETAGRGPEQPGRLVVVPIIGGNPQPPSLCLPDRVSSSRARSTSLNRSATRSVRPEDIQVVVLILVSILREPP